MRKFADATSATDSAQLWGATSAARASARKQSASLALSTRCYGCHL